MMYGMPFYQGNFSSQPIYNQQQAQLSQDERIWVQNETSAEAYLLAPNGFARLWDSSSNRFYEKRADATGRPLPMDIYEYKRVTPQIASLSEKVDKSSLDDINAKFEAINARIEALESAKKGAGKNGTKSNADDTSI